MFIWIQKNRFFFCLNLTENPVTINLSGLFRILSLSSSLLCVFFFEKNDANQHNSSLYFTFSFLQMLFLNKIFSKIKKKQNSSINFWLISFFHFLILNRQTHRQRNHQRIEKFFNNNHWKMLSNNKKRSCFFVTQGEIKRWRNQNKNPSIRTAIYIYFFGLLLLTKSMLLLLLLASLWWLVKMNSGTMMRWGGKKRQP